MKFARCLAAHPFVWFFAVALARAGAAEPDAAPVGERNVDGIMDNSFLVEEAYNQEPDVIQHIATAFYSVNRRGSQDLSAWNLSFTQEWPVFSQTHQFSYTIPYSFIRLNGRSVNGVGDVLLNYRFQAYLNERNLMAFAPRASLILPTGNPDRGLGDDTVGAQINLPFSTAIGDRWFVHLNAGLTYLPEAASAQKRDLTSYNLGASAIYAATRDVHFLVEWTGSWNQLGETGRPRIREFAALISPGVRKAFNFSNGAQLVLGVAAPVGLTAAAPDVGVFLYFSFEHSLHPARRSTAK